MRLKHVTISGVNETTDIAELLDLLREYPSVEIGIQVNEKKCEYYNNRMEWIRLLARTLCYCRIPSDCERGYELQTIKAALHVNPSWVEDFGQGIVPAGLHTLLAMRNTKGDPFFGRVQLNFKIGRDRTPDEYKLLELMQLYRSRRFIFSFNQSNAEFIHKMHKLCNEVNLNFDLLYDDSHGEGVVPKERPKVLNNLPVGISCQGFAGGIGPDNVEDVLASIFAQEKDVHYDTLVAIDAEGKLKDKDGNLDLKICRRYIETAIRWRSEHLKSLML